MAAPRIPLMAGEPKFTPSRSLVKATYRLLMADKSMVALLFGGGLAAATVLGAIMFPAWFFGHITPNVIGGGLPGLLVYAAALWAASFVMALVTGAVVAAAMIRADGGAPTVRAALAVAWSRRWQLAAWAMVTAIVGVLMNLLERLGIAGLAVRLVVGIGWAVATIFAVPLVVSEGTLPAATLRRSATMVRDTFGTTLRSNIRLAVPWVIGMIVALIAAVTGVIIMIVGVNDHQAGTALTGAAFAVVGGVSFFFTVVTSAALSAYLNTMIFRYANGQPIPGINPADLPPLRTAS